MSLPQLDAPIQELARLHGKSTASEVAKILMKPAGLPKETDELLAWFMEVAKVEVAKAASKATPPSSAAPASSQQAC